MAWVLTIEVHRKEVWVTYQEIMGGLIAMVMTAIIIIIIIIIIIGVWPIEWTSTFGA